MANVSNISLRTSEALLPTAYSLQEVTITNHAGVSYDVKALVTTLTITESIYRSALMISIDIKDPVNTIEEFQLTGQERISIKIARRPYGSQDEERVELEFLVSEYPIFGRFGDRLQAYSIRGVSPHAYLSELKKVSRAFSGDIRDFVRSVLQDDLNVSSDDIVMSEKSTALVKFIVPNLKPMDAIHWAARRAFDDSGAPFYIYQRMDGKICFHSHTELVQQESFKEFRDAKFFQHNQTGTTDLKKDYDERSKRIISLASDLKMNKYGAIPAGAYSSKTFYLDASNKTYTSSTFDYNDSFSSMNWINENPIATTDFRPNETNPLSAFPESRLNYISNNVHAFDDGDHNYHFPTSNGTINKAHCYLENLDASAHDLTLAGDFALRAGAMISMSVPPAIDPQAVKKNSASVNDPKKDSYFSGKYLITSSVHKFDDMYTVDVKIKRDSLPFKLTSS